MNGVHPFRGSPLSCFNANGPSALDGMSLAQRDVFRQWTHVSLTVRTSVALGFILVALEKNPVFSTKKKSCCTQGGGRVGP